MGWLKKIFGPARAPAEAAARPAARANRPGRVRPPRPIDWRSFDFDDVAATYARVFESVTAAPYADLVSLCAPAASDRILDIGCGTGAGLATLDGTAAGIDLSETMLRQATRAHPGLAVAAADIIDLPFADATFGVVVGAFVLPYVTKMDTALFDLLRVTRPGGRIGISVWTEVLDDLTRAWRDLVEARLGPELVRDAFAQGIPWADTVADPHRLETVLRDAGLRPVRVERRRYRTELTRDEYLDGKAVGVLGRYLHSMLGDAAWGGFMDGARAAFAERFGPQVVDFRDVLLAVGTKPLPR